MTSNIPVAVDQEERPNVVPFPGTSLYDLPHFIDSDEVLELAKGKLETVMVLGWGADGELWISSSENRKPELVYLLNTVLHRLLSGRYG